MNSNKISILFLALAFVYFFYATLQHLSLPFYWDTAAFLIPAAKEIAETRDILHYTNGMTDYPHTFLLQTLLAIFFVLFKNPITPIHMFSVAISFIFLISLFLILTKVYKKNYFTPAAIILLFATNPLFIAQTNLVYFEIFALLFRISAIFFLFKKNAKLFFLFGFLAFITRFENGLILGPTGIIYFFFEKQKKLLIASLSLIGTTGAWLLFHQMKTGWLLFSPERHFEESPLNTIFESSSYLFLWQGRYVISTLILLFLTTYFLKKYSKIKKTSLLSILKKIKTNKFFLLLVISALPTYLILYKLGYFLPRYILPLVLPFYLSFILIIQKQSLVTKTALVLLVVLVQLLNSQNCFSFNYEDCNLVTDFIYAKQEVISQIELKHSQSMIYSWHEDNNALSNPYLGYSKNLLQVTTDPNEQTNLIFVTPTSAGTVYSYASSNNYALITKKEFIQNIFCIPYTFKTSECTRNQHKTIFLFKK